MGRHKLLLPWDDGTVMDQCLKAWTASDVDRVVVVVRVGDEPLIEICRRHDVDLVTPERDPVDMRESVQFALTHTRDRYQPAASDVWMLAPADMPALSSRAINCLLARYDGRHPRLMIAAYRGRRGHPVLFPWPTAEDVLRLEPGQGIDMITRRAEVVEIEIDEPGILSDLDTTSDYDRLRAGQIDIPPEHLAGHTSQMPPSSSRGRVHQ
jgi:molybdenum cofactor cytidylyltransferase